MVSMSKYGTFKVDVMRQPRARGAGVAANLLWENKEKARVGGKSHFAVFAAVSLQRAFGTVFKFNADVGIVLINTGKHINSYRT